MLLGLHNGLIIPPATTVTPTTGDQVRGDYRELTKCMGMLCITLEITYNGCFIKVYTIHCDPHFRLMRKRKAPEAKQLFIITMSGKVLLI